MIAYSWAMVAASLLLWPIAGISVLYTVVAVAVGGAFLRETYALRGRIRRGEAARPARVFHASISYLTVLFLAAALVTLLPPSWP
jgi:protoheme IX farnesyltransferase